jgi:pimeloyl-ACP methyl ester carboxylesterase
LVAGAGPRNRDSQVWGHRPFLILADYLTRKGIAVLRTDDRGTGKSGGTFETAGFEDFASDAGAALAYLKTRREIDARRIGWIGHREGSVVVSAAAAANPGTAFVVLMPGVGLSGEENMVAQVRYLSLLNHSATDAADQAANTQRKILDIARAEKTAPAMAKRVNEEIPMLNPSASDFEDLAKPWFLSYIAFDPAGALAKVKSPVLALWGEKDHEVEMKANQAAIQKALEAAGNKNVEFAELPGLNHLFQTSDTGLAWQYPEIEETLAPAAMEIVAGWILKTTGK